jgi:hypothetical protein
VGNYATSTEVKAFKVDGVVVDLTSYTDAEIDVDIGLAEDFIERITNNIFYSKTETNQFDGNGLHKLFFFPSIVYPVISITSVKDVDIDGTVLDTLVENQDFITYPHYLEVSLAFPEDSPRRRISQGGNWPKGQKNIHVEGTWGRSVLPPAIKRATILLTLERLKPQSTGMVPKDIKQAVWPDFTVTFRGREEDLVGQSTGYNLIDRLLEPYLNNVDMFLVVPDTKQTFDTSPFRAP